MSAQADWLEQLRKKTESLLTAPSATVPALIAEAERRIRQEPLASTSELLKKVFGAGQMNQACRKDGSVAACGCKICVQ